MENGINRLILQDKPVNILLAIDNIEKPYTSTIIKEVDTTFSHATNLLSEMEKFGLIRFLKVGRVKYVELTDQGKKIVRLLKNLISALNQTDEKIEDKTSTKISDISSKLDLIFEEELKNKDKLDKSEFIHVSQRLGPYKREIDKLGQSIEDEKLKKDAEYLKNRLNELISVKENLKCV